MSRSKMVVLALVAMLAMAACAPPVPVNGISPSDGTGYVTPLVSGDGNTVVYRREADQNAFYDDARDLVVTRVSPPSTQTFPGVRSILAISHDGRFVVHGRVTTSRLDTTTGAEVVLTTGAYGAGFAISDDGSTVVSNGIRYTAGNCPCQRHVTVWHNGAPALDHDLGATINSSNGIDDDFRDFVAVAGDGSAAFVSRWATRDVVRIDTTTGAESVVPLQLPPVTGFAPPETLRIHLFWGEWVDFTSSDATTFRFTQDNAVYLVAATHAPLPVPALTTAVGDTPPTLSPNGRWAAQVTRTLVRPGVNLAAYTVTDLATGNARQVVTSEEGFPAGSGPFRTFNGVPSVSDDGRVSYGQWNVPPSGIWDPSVIRIDG